MKSYCLAVGYVGHLSPGQYLSWRPLPRSSERILFSRITNASATTLQRDRKKFLRLRAIPSITVGTRSSSSRIRSYFFFSLFCFFSFRSAPSRRTRRTRKPRCVYRRREMVGNPSIFDPRLLGAGSLDGYRAQTIYRCEYVPGHGCRSCRTDSCYLHFRLILVQLSAENRTQTEIRNLERNFLTCRRYRR